MNAVNIQVVTLWYLSREQGGLTIWSFCPPVAFFYVIKFVFALPLLHFMIDLTEFLFNTQRWSSLKKNDLYRKWIWRLCQTRYLQSQSKILVSFLSRKCSKWTKSCFQCLQLKPNAMSLSKRLSELSKKKEKNS